jgi:hypothetical protein
MYRQPDLQLSFEALQHAVKKIAPVNYRRRPPKETEARKVSYQALRGRQQRKATPKWANKAKMKALYLKAQVLTEATGIEHHVDHIIPIMGRNVCGLHVHYNMRVTSAFINLRKSNKFG